VLELPGVSVGGCMMVTEKRLIDQLREMADRTPPICQYDKPEKTMIFGKEITVYCKPFEQFQELLRRAADALDVDAVEVVRCKDCKHWQPIHEHIPHMECQIFCGAYEHGYPTNAYDFCFYGERKDNVL
jgi:uncharacterized protein YbaR (Trm112 family)